MSTPGTFSLIKPTVNTPFHIDFKWWVANDSNWRVYLFNCLCQEHQVAYAEVNEDSWVDWVDPETAEVTQVNGLQHVLMTHCIKQPEFVTENTTLVDAVFRVFLANGNIPLAPLQLSEQTGKPAQLILKTLTGAKIYKGLRPVGKTTS